MHKFLKRGNFVALMVGFIMLVFVIDTSLKALAQEQKKHAIEEEVNFQRPEPSRPIQPEVPGVNRYQDDKVFLEYADSLYKVKTRRDTIERQILKGNVKFRQAGLWMYCDSAYYYPEENSLDAFSNVRMEQGDTLFVYADKLFYNGDEHLAKLKNGPTREKVTLINKEVTLTTDSLDYDMILDKGWYLRWGTLEDKVNNLTSLYGEYSPKTKLAEFFQDVVLENVKDGYTMYTDTLYYSTDTHIAEIVSRTEIQSENDTIITSLATYYTDNGNADLLSRSMIIHRDSTGNVVTLEGDSIIYDNATRISRAYMFRDPFKRSTPMVITDTAQKTTLIGGFGIYNDSTREALATDYPLLMEYSQSDTLFLRADTIKTFIVTEMLPDKRRKTKSGFPEHEGIPVTMIDSLGKLWIDTTYFKVEIPLATAPLKMLMKVAPPYTKPEPKPQIEEAISIIDFETDLDSEGVLDFSLTQDRVAQDVSVIMNDSIPDKIEFEADVVEKDIIVSEQIIPIEKDTIQKQQESAINIDNSIIERNDTLINQRDSVIILNETRLELNDSLNYSGDSGLILKDSLGSILIGDSLSLAIGDDNSLVLETDTIIDAEDYLKPDSIPHEFHVVLAYHRGRFFKQDMQGVADSIVFVERDSMLYMFRKPIIWSEERQVTGNRIDVHFNDSTTDWAYLPEFGLMSEWVDEDFYNQIYGKEITAYFENQGLRRMNISGNVETIFLPQESDSTFNRLVNAESSYMDVYMTANKLDWMKMWPEVSGTVTPIFLVKRNQMYLQKFKWWGFLRPEREWYGDQQRWADNLGEVPDELEQYFLTPSDFGEPKSFTGPRIVLPPTSLPMAEIASLNQPVDSLNNLGTDLDSLLNEPADNINIPNSIQTGAESEAMKEAEDKETLSDIEESLDQEKRDAEETEVQTQEIEEAVKTEEEDTSEGKELSGDEIKENEEETETIDTEEFSKIMDEAVKEGEEETNE